MNRHDDDARQAARRDMARDDRDAARWADEPSRRPSGNPREALLKETLRLGVPLEMQKLAGLPAEAIGRMAAKIDTHDLHGDDALFGGPHAREGVANLIRALALLAHAEGGVTFAGLHWCTDHAHCVEVAAHA